jgi:hypothetical protein
MDSSSRAGHKYRKGKKAMRTIRAFVVLLILLTLFLSGCGLIREQDEPNVNLTEIFPTDLPTIEQAHRLDVDGAGIKEWLVFYHIDSIAGEPEGSPIAAAVYRPVSQQDKRVPPQLVPTLLWLPNQGYVCLYTCEAEMEDVIGENPPGRELVIRDKRDEDTVGVAIFRWDATLVPESEGGDAIEGGFVPLGHFRGDSITLEENRVTVRRRSRDRSNLEIEEIYEAQSGRYYQAAVRSVYGPPSELRLPNTAQIVFGLGPPENPAEVKLPEKLVLALYENYTDLEEIKEYFTGRAWTDMGGRCPENVCGCASKHEDVSRVMVKQIAYEGALKKSTNVVTQVVCVNRNNRPDPIGTVTWQLQRLPESTWRLSSVTPGGDDFLCPRTNCLQAGSGE